MSVLQARWESQGKSKVDFVSVFSNILQLGPSDGLRWSRDTIYSSVPWADFSEKRKQRWNSAVLITWQSVTWFQNTRGRATDRGLNKTSLWEKDVQLSGSCRQCPAGWWGWTKGSGFTRRSRSQWPSHSPSGAKAYRRGAHTGEADNAWKKFCTFNNHPLLYTQ